MILTSHAQVCYPNGITFSSQAEVDLFPAVNPGCSIIGEDLTINGSDITNLDSLYPLEKIQGDFILFSNNLSNFEGCNNIDTIFGRFRFQGGSSPANFQGFESLKVLGSDNISHFIAGVNIENFLGLDSLVELNGNLDIISCGNLTSLDGLQGISALQQLYISNCFSFNSLIGLNNVSNIENLRLYDLSILTNLSGLESLDSCSGIEFNDLSALDDISALSNLTYSNSFSIDDCDALTNLDGLENLAVVNTSFNLRYNAVLNDISAIENTDLQNMYGLSIYQNPELEICNYNSICAFVNIEGNANIYSNDTGCNGIIEVENSCCVDNPIWCPENMETCYPNGITFSSQAEVDLFPAVNPGCSIIGENLIIDGTDITNLDSLYPLEKIQGDFILFSNNLSNFEGCNNIDTIFGRFRFQGGSSPANFQGFESLKVLGSDNISHFIAGVNIENFLGLDSLVELNGNLDIISCGNLTSLDGLQGISALQQLYISNCFSFNSLIGLNNVSNIENLRLYDLSILTNLSGLESLDSCSGIEFNDLSALDDISALSNLTYSNSFSIDDCDALTNLDGLENLAVVNTSFNLRYNAVLNDISAIENTDLQNMYGLSIYQNPELEICNYNSICAFVNIEGNANIYSNDTGCNGTVEVENNCCLDDPIWCPENMETCYPNGITFSSQAEVDLFPAVNPGCSIIGENLIIDGADITNLDSLYPLEKIQGDFILFSNNLSNFEGCNNIDTIFGRFRFQGGSSPVNFQGFESLKVLGSDNISHFIAGVNIENFLGLDSLVELNGNLDIISCGNLTSLDGLQGISALQQLYVSNCFSFNSLIGLNNVSNIENLRLYDLSILTNLSGLESLDSCSGIEFNDLFALDDISALSNLTYSNSFSIDDCDALTNLDGLENLAVVNTSFNLRYNDVLNDISSVENTDFKNMYSLNIYQNPELSFCNQNSICEYLDNELNASIYSNDPGCNGVVEIEYDCLGLLSIFEITPPTFSGNSVDNFWHNASNWRSNLVPTDSSYTIIPSSAVVDIQQDSIAVCKLLNIQPGATLNCMTGSQLNVWGEE